MKYSRDKDCAKNEKSLMKEEEEILKMDEEYNNEYNKLIEDQEVDEENEYDKKEDIKYSLKIGDEVIFLAVIEIKERYVHRRWSCGIITDINRIGIIVNIYDYVCDKDAYYPMFLTKHIELGTNGYWWLKNNKSENSYILYFSNNDFEVYKREHIECESDFKNDIFIDGIDEFYWFEGHNYVK